MLQARDFVEHQILWKIRRGNSSIWFDKWIAVGDLYIVIQENRDCDDRYKCGRLNAKWEVNDHLIIEIFPDEVAGRILDKIKPPIIIGRKDRPV